jgi:hypothetical protein
MKAPTESKTTASRQNKSKRKKRDGNEDCSPLLFL